MAGRESAGVAPEREMVDWIGAAGLAFGAIGAADVIYRQASLRYRLGKLQAEGQGRKARIETGALSMIQKENIAHRRRAEKKIARMDSAIGYSYLVVFGGLASALTVAAIAAFAYPQAPFWWELPALAALAVGWGSYRVLSWRAEKMGYDSASKPPRPREVRLTWGEHDYSVEDETTR